MSCNAGAGGTHCQGASMAGAGWRELASGGSARDHSTSRLAVWTRCFLCALKHRLTCDVLCRCSWQQSRGTPPARCGMCRCCLQWRSRWGVVAPSWLHIRLVLYPALACVLNHQAPCRCSWQQLPGTPPARCEMCQCCLQRRSRWGAAQASAMNFTAAPESSSLLSG